MIQRHHLPATLAIAAASALAAACYGGPPATQGASPSPSPYASPTSGDIADTAREGAETAGEKIKEGAEKAGEIIKETARDVKEKAKPAAEEAKREAKPVAKDVGRTLDAAKQQLDVKAALLADKTVDASRIDVDVDKDAKVLYLRGTVPTAAQKTAAEKIARDKAEGYVVRNELTVMAKP